MHGPRRAATAALIAVGLAATAIAPAHARAVRWTPPQDTRGPAVAATLADGTTVLITVGGERDTVVFEQRRSPDGTLGERTAIGPVERGAYCAPLLVDVQRSTIGLVVRCQARTGLEDPPSISVEMVWTEATGWSSRDRRRSSPLSVDVSPNGEHVVFTTDNEYYQRPSHVSSYDVVLGWSDRTWAERGVWGDRLVAAVDNAGDVEVARSTGFEDEPGAWIGGAVELMHYDEGTDAWVRDFLRKGHGVGVTDLELDRAADGRLFGSYVRHFGNQEELWVLRADAPTDPALVQAGRRSPDLYSQASVSTGRGWGYVGWQQATARGEYQTFVKRWRGGGAGLRGGAIGAGGTVVPVLQSGLTVSLAVNGRHLLLTWIRHRGEQSTTHAYMFYGQAHGEDFRFARVRQSPRATVQASQGAGGAAALLLGRWRWYRVLSGAEVSFLEEGPEPPPAHDLSPTPW